VDKLDDSRETAAGALDATDSILHTRGEQISGAAHSAVNKIHATANYVRQTNLKGMVDDFGGYSEALSGADFGGCCLLGISRRARFSPLRLIAPHQEARYGHRSCFSWLSGRIHEGQCRRFRLSLKLPFGQISQKSKSPERITSPGFALC